MAQFASLNQHLIHIILPTYLIQETQRLNLRSIISTFYHTRVTVVDRVFFSLVFTILLASLILFALNAFDFHFTAVPLFSTLPFSFSIVIVTIFTLLFGCVLIIHGLYIRTESPRASNFLWGLGLLFWAGLANLALANALQSTPFSPIDHILVKIDRWMGIHTETLMTWTHDHPLYYTILTTIYASLTYQLIVSIFLLVLFNTRRAISVFFIAELSTFLIGSFIYYFFPTVAPSGVFHSPYFSVSQHDTSLRFYDVHHFIKNSIVDGGLIAFPSFHVIWAILITYSWINKKIIFYPVCALNIILIISTVLLGWHYFADVIAGIILAAMGIIFGERAYSHARF